MLSYKAVGSAISLKGLLIFGDVLAQVDNLNPFSPTLEVAYERGYFSEQEYVAEMNRRGRLNKTLNRNEFKEHLEKRLGFSYLYLGLGAGILLGRRKKEYGLV